MLISIGCSHRPAVSPVPAPDWERGFETVPMYGDDFDYLGDGYCLTENDYRELYLFILNVDSTCGIEY